jgi:hypothetical protein
MIQIFVLAGWPDLRDVLRVMTAEHCESFDSDQEFITSNYKVKTTPRREWRIVVNCEESLADMSHNRRLQKLDEIMQRPEVVALGISREEVIAIVLYTGPMVRPCTYCCNSVCNN